MTFLMAFMACAVIMTDLYNYQGMRDLDDLHNYYSVHDLYDLYNYQGMRNLHDLHNHHSVYDFYDLHNHHSVRDFLDLHNHHTYAKKTLGPSSEAFNSVSPMRQCDFFLNVSDPRSSCQLQPGIQLIGFQ